MLIALLVLLAVFQAPPAAESPLPDVPAEIARWEPDVAALEERDRTEATGTAAILFCGSSSIRRWDTIHEDMAPWPVIQRGYGGARLSDLGHYADRVIGPRLGPDNPRRPRAIVLFLANDIAGNEELDVSPEEVLIRFRKLHDYIRAADATLPIFWIEVTANSSRVAVWPQVQEATRLIRQRLAVDPNAHFIATAGVFLGPDGPRDGWFVEDRLHLNADGYKVWAALIAARLHEVLGPAIPPDVAEWANEIASFEATDDAAPDRPVIFYGSSSFRLWDTMAGDMAPLPVLNRGYGGASLRDAAFYVRRVLRPHQPRSVVLFVGGDIYLRDRSPAAAEEDFRKLLSNIRAEKGEVPVVWLTLRPVLAFEDKWPQVQELNDRVRRVVSEDANAYVLDVNGPLLTEDGGPRVDQFADDRVHLNDAGYRAWTREIRAKLLALLGPTAAR